MPTSARWPGLRERLRRMHSPKPPLEGGWCAKHTGEVSAAFCGKSAAYPRTVTPLRHTLQVCPRVATKPSRTMLRSAKASGCPTAAVASSAAGGAPLRASPQGEASGAAVQTAFESQQALHEKPLRGAGRCGHRPLRRFKPPANNDQSLPECPAGFRGGSAVSSLAAVPQAVPEGPGIGKRCALRAL